MQKLVSEYDIIIYQYYYVYIKRVFNVNNRYDQITWERCDVEIRKITALELLVPQLTSTLLAKVTHVIITAIVYYRNHLYLASHSLIQRNLIYNSLF